MRNLQVFRTKVYPADEKLKDAQDFCLNCDSGCVWIATTTALCCIEASDGEVQAVVPLDGHMTSGDRVISMDYLIDSESICMGLSGGNILTYSVGTGELETVGEVEDGGIAGMSWSPEQDLVVIVTGSNKLLLMTREFDQLNEVPLYQEDFGEAKPVTVGWGTKETQFRGTAGKPKPEDLRKKTQGPALDWDDKRVRISWRGNGDYFACSSVDMATGGRVIRIWSRECVLHSTCETLDGLQQSLAWKPSGNLLASLQLKKSQRNDVVFFEPNGLQHGEFSFRAPPTELQVRELLWSHDSSVLCAWCVRGDTGKEMVQLWTSGNYHWYLKQNIHLMERQEGKTEEGEGHVGRFTSLVGLQWDPVMTLKLHMLTSDGQYLSYDFEWTVSESKSHTGSNVSGVAVIDGCQVLYTPFRYSIVPPPMSASQYLLPSPVSEVVFGPQTCCNDFLAVLSNFQVAVFSPGAVEPAATTGPVPRHPLPKLIGISRIEGAGTAFHSMRQFVWWHEECVLAVSVDDVTGQEAVVQLALEVDASKGTVRCQLRQSVNVTGGVVCLYGNPDTGTVVVQLSSGDILNWNGTEAAEQSLPLSPRLLGDSRTPLRLAQPCGKIELALFNGKERLVGLSGRRGKLFVDDLELTSGCTSFAVHDEHLLLITNTHFCRFVSLNPEPEVLVSLDADELDKQQSVNSSVRRVERGSHIVTVIPDDTRMLLQMPRGNLEVVSPRALTLAQIRRDLDCLEFSHAFLNVRTNRINFNILYDHHPQAFLDNVPKFVNNLKSVTNINLFLAALIEEDVTKTMYGLPITSSHGNSRASEGGGANSNAKARTKLDTVCDAVREELVKCGQERYFLSIITAHVKKTRPELEMVLQMIQKLKDSSDSVSDSKDAVTVDSALKYTMYMVDVNKLYNIALGMYDLPLVVMVAEKSQKDPKEYLPFLNGLRKLPLDYQRYKIDCYLKRYDKALHHIAKCGQENFQECLSLINEHSLHKEAISIYTDKKSEEYQTVARAYGHQLNKDGKHKEAGLIFSQCGCHEEALQAFEKGGCWEQVFVASSHLQHTPAQRMEVGRRLASSLKSSRCYTEACRVLLDYVSDPEEAVVALLEGSCWEEALRLIHFHHRLDLLETNFFPCLEDARESQLSLLNTLKNDFQCRFSRLCVVRENKRKKQQAILEGTYAVDEKDADLFSDTSSVTGRSLVSSTDSTVLTSSSKFSKTSGRSSKNRRKAQNKKHKLREGSRYEEEALVDLLKDIVASADGAREDVHKLLSCLVQFGFSEKAVDLQSCYGETLDNIKVNMDSIWPPGSSTQSAVNGANPLGLGPRATVNTILAARAASFQATPEIINPGAPKLREDVKWKLTVL